MARFFNISAGTIEFTDADSGTASIDIDHFDTQSFTAFVSGTIEEEAIYTNVKVIASGTQVSDPSTNDVEAGILDTDDYSGSSGNNWLIMSGTVSAPNAIYIGNTEDFDSKTGGYPMVGIGSRTVYNASGWIQYANKFSVDTVVSFEYIHGSNNIDVGTGYPTSWNDDGQTIAIQYSTDGDTWTTQDDVYDATEGSATSFTVVSKTITRSSVGADYYIRLFITTDGAPTADTQWVLGFGELNIKYQTDSTETINTIADVGVTATYDSATNTLTAYTTSKLTGKVHYKIISSK